MTALVARRFETVADARECRYQCLTGIAGLELGPQPANPGAQVMGLVPELRAPDAAHQLAMEHHPSYVGRELVQQCPLGAAQPGLCLTNEHTTTVEVDLDAGIGEDGASTRRNIALRPAQHGCNPGGQLVRVERLGDVVVGSPLQTL